MKKQRQGGCEIEAFGINLSIKIKTSKLHLLQQQQQEEEEVQVLKDVNCRAKPWEILAIVGPSGAGKSSLLEILSGKVAPQSGCIFINEKPIHHRAELNRISGYVTQKDILFPLLTVEETLMFSAKLRLKLPQIQLKSRVKSLIQELGLDHVATTRIGDDDGVRGISGGERRRVSIGVDVIHDPKVLILDEPTSGLDSTSALQIIGMLKVMAESRGRSIILSIHQPGFRIVKLFNSLVLLANGLVLHQGTVDQLGARLNEMGLRLPRHINVVEFAIDSIDSIIQQQQPQSGGCCGGGQQQQQQSRNSKLTLQQLFQQSNDDDDDDDCGGGGGGDYANSRLKETMILTQRFSKNIFRTKELFACRTIQMLVSGLVLGSIFHNVKDDLSGAEEKVGLFAFILTFLLSCTTEALPIFLQDREILIKETCCGSYRVSSYAIASGLVYLPFLLILALAFAIPLYWLVGLNPSLMAFLHFILLIWLILYTANSVVVCFSALVPNFIVGNSVISGVMGSFFLFSGYFISKHGIPDYWIFMHYISLFKYPFEEFLINEFSSSSSSSSKCLEYLFGRCVVRGEDVMRDQGYGGEESWRNIVIMLAFILLYRFASYVILRFRCDANRQ